MWAISALLRYMLILKQALSLILIPITTTIGHFSKFIRPGAKRIASAASRDKLLTTAYRNPDGKLAVVVMNKNDEKIEYYLWIKGQAAKVTANPHSIATLIVTSKL